MWRARGLLLAAMATVPLYLALDTMRLVPPSLRDRPWPFALLAIGLAMGARRSRLAAAVAIVASGGLLYVAHARYQLPPSAMAEGLLPDVTLQDQAGAPVRLRDWTGAPTLLIWFRGSWCPYCRAQLADLAKESALYTPVRIVAVAPDPPPPLAKLKSDLAIPFTLLSDPQGQLVNRCELAHCAAILDGNGRIVWGVLSGNWENELPARALLQAAYRAR